MQSFVISSSLLAPNATQAVIERPPFPQPHRQNMSWAITPMLDFGASENKNVLGYSEIRQSAIQPGDRVATRVVLIERPPGHH